MYYARLDREKGIEQALSKHLKGVAQRGLESISKAVRFKPFSHHTINDLCYWINYFHDLGKYTGYFQLYLQTGKESEFKNHAHISALYLYSFLQKRMGIKDFKSEENALAFIAYLCVRFHHGNLNLKGLFDIANQNRRLRELQHQVEDMKGKIPSILKDSGLEKVVSVKDFRDYGNVQNWQDNSKLHLMQKYIATRLKNEKWFFILVYLFSLLIDADKMDSAELKKEKTKPLKPTAVEEYLKNMIRTSKKNDFTAKRQAVRQTIINVLKNLSDEEVSEQYFFTLTAPTGTGKTLASLEAAVYLQHRLKEISHNAYIPRIITAIPFINIIEQTRLVYEQVIEDSATIITHHQLSDLTIKSDNREEITIDKKLLEVEAWEGDVILTTFVQLFHSIFTGKNRSLKKFNKLAGSIVILDEVQSLPERYIPLIAATLASISKYFRTRFILMTATQPRLLESANKILPENPVSLELLPDNSVYFQELKRTRFIPCLNEKLNTQQFIEFFMTKWQREKAALIVVNTIKRSIDIFNFLNKNLATEHPQVKLLYLSTNIIPKQREAVINEAEHYLKNKKPLVMVSTQSIEAGVDLDFDLGFRDLAPLTSLVQTAGRINREGGKGEYIPVYIVQIESDHSYVYKLHNLADTKELLAKYTEIPETEYQNLINEYYTRVQNRPLPSESKNIWSEGILGLDFEEIESFRLIENIGEVIDVFVEYDNEASAIADAYEDLISGKETINKQLFAGLIDESMLTKLNSRPSIYERKTLLRIIRGKMNRYVVQIRLSRTKDNIPVEFAARNGLKSELFWIPPGQIDDYYDHQTGFKDEKGGAYIF
jgi:CRISPR-associated endonuclease/helicase Cas3